MVNTNCLDGIKCPECGADDVFFLEARVVLKITDEGTTDADYPHEWDDDDRMSCLNDGCEFTGAVREFRGGEKKAIVNQLTQAVRDSLYENIAAISGDFHRDSRYDAFYKAHAEGLGGFPGIYTLCIDMAKALANYENSFGGSAEFYSGSVDWVELVEAFIDEIMKAEEIDIEAALAAAMRRFVA